MKSKNKINWDALWIILTIIGFVAIISVIFVGGERGWFKTLYIAEGDEIINLLNNPEKFGSCSLQITPTFIISGESVEAILMANPNSLCYVFANDGSDWVSVYNGYTDFYGQIRQVIPVDSVGTFQIRAICDADQDNRINLGDCITEEKSLQVDPKMSTCSENDGGKDINLPGTTTAEGVGYMDYCLDIGEAVHEYWCEGSELNEANYACDYGQFCVSTRSGGYCEDVSYSEGDILQDISDSQTTSGNYNLDINLGSIQSGGNCRLGAHISTNWDYFNEKCQGLQGSEGVVWTFYDSAGIAYTRTDTNPVGLGVDLCPLNFEPGKNWRLTAQKSLGLPDCEIGYQSQVQVYVCECSN